jgi:hypothetical protein
MSQVVLYRVDNVLTRVDQSLFMKFFTLLDVSGFEQVPILVGIFFLERLTSTYLLFLLPEYLDMLLFDLRSPRARGEITVCL